MLENKKTEFIFFPTEFKIKPDLSEQDNRKYTNTCRI